MKTLKIALLLCVAFFSSLIAASQTTIDSTFIQIETLDGNRFYGKIISESSEKLVLSTEYLGEVEIDTKNIKSRRLIHSRELRDGKLWFDNPQSSRYFWAPNGYGLKKGEGYYQNIWVIWNQFAYGITDNFSLGGAVIPLFLFGGTATPVFLSPKFSLPISKDKFNIGAGALIGTVLGESDTGFGIAYGVTTFGSTDNNLSVGLGYAYAEGEWATTPLINISGMTRISPRWYLMSENNFLIIDGEAGGMISGGARWIIKKAALDFGFFIPAGTGADEFIAIPWLGFTVPFGKVI